MSGWIKAFQGATPGAMTDAVLLGFAVGAVTLAVMWLLRRVARYRYRRYAQTEELEFLEIPLKVASETNWLFMLVMAACSGFATAGLAGRPQLLLEKTVAIALFWQAGVWVSAAANAWLDHRRQVALETDKAAAGSIAVIRFIVRVCVWALVLLLTLQNLGVDVTALVAGLGIGGIAIALAVQKVLGDLLASLSIALDRPFVVGDFLIVGEHMGSVEFIGIKSTRLRSLSGEQIVMSNADLLGGRLRNYGRMQERRVVFSIGVTYDTPRDKLTAVLKVLRSAIEEQESVRFDRAHFARFGAYSLDFECVYYVLSADYTRYMDIQQAINFRIYEELERLGVQFAYPTQVVLMPNPASAASATPAPDALDPDAGPERGKRAFQGPRPVSQASK